MPSDLFSPVDDLTQSLISENENIKYLSEGKLFCFDDFNLSATASTVMYTLYRTGSKRVRINVARQAIGGGTVTIKLYKNPTITTNGTELVVSNRNDCFGNVSEMKVYGSDTVVATTGTIIKSADFIFSTATGSANKTTSASGDTVPWQWDANSVYLTKATFSGDTSYSMKASFYELDNDKEAP